MRDRGPRAAGLTIIELMVVIAIIGLLMALAVPRFSEALASMRDRSVMEKFLQDYEWLRSMASRPGVTSATLVLNADCSWTASLATAPAPAPVADDAHSATAAEIKAMRAVLACTADPPLAMPVNFTVSSAGFVTPNGSVTFQGRNNQTWPLQVLFSGSLVRLKGAQ